MLEAEAAGALTEPAPGFNAEYKEVMVVEVLITGGDTELGRAVAEGFHNEGHMVTLLGARRDDLEVAAKLNMLHLKVGESFVICKLWNGEKRQPPRWDVRLAAAGEVVRAAGGDESGPPVAAARQARGSPADTGRDLWLVHRRL